MAYLCDTKEINAERGEIIPATDEIVPERDEIVADSPEIVPATDEIVAANDEINAERDVIVAASGEIVAERDVIETERDEIVPERVRTIPLGASRRRGGSDVRPGGSVTAACLLHIPRRGAPGRPAPNGWQRVATLQLIPERTATRQPRYQPLRITT